VWGAAPETQHNLLSLLLERVEAARGAELTRGSLKRQLLTGRGGCTVRAHGPRETTVIARVHVELVTDTE